jgi:hypothetical protein
MRKTSYTWETTTWKAKRWYINIDTGLGEMGFHGTAPLPCPLAGFGIGEVESLGSATTLLVKKIRYIIIH